MVSFLCLVFLHELKLSPSIKALTYYDKKKLGLDPKESIVMDWCGKSGSSSGNLPKDGDLSTCTQKDQDEQRYELLFGLC